MYFRDVVGQDILKSRFVNTVEENRLSHAWLLFGPEGAGALPLALSFASYILCNDRKGGDSCGLCPACKKSHKLIHPDLHLVFPVNRTKSVDLDGPASDDFLSEWRIFILNKPYGRITQWYDHIDLDNRQGLINIEESKRLSYKLSLKSFESDYKVVVIWHPEKMNDQAGNKLLKLLEEPPEKTIFILVSENPDVLLSTIRSRCIPVKVPRIADSDIKQKLIEEHHLPVNDASEITALSQGNYLKALEMITEADEYNYNFVKFRDLMRSCLTTSILQLIAHAEELSGLNREKQKSFLEYGLKTIRESVALHYEDAGIAFVTRGEMEFTPKFAPYINGNNVLRITEELNKAIRDIERNVNSRMVFLDLGLKLSGMIKRNIKN
ncbi:MAG TPA: DNA polymerase III subunit delta' [Bacteroidales bacterium]|nr:DNA polymerase III subunit delta' [Bacteroidales bacterium]